MTHREIRKKFLEFFKKRGHAILPSASLVPENDPSVLFTTAGMQPLVPYLMGESHPQGRRLANIQKCVRTQDIDEVGDNTHDTFFEMMGNWSLGDYFKEDAIKWSYELLTSKEEGFGLDPARIYVTVFAGDENAPRDEESAAIWRSLGVPESRIYFLGADSNWWSPGPNGPCGPDTEMFYDITEGGLGDMSEEEFLVADDAQKVVEIWNDVFMEFEKKDGKVIGKLAKRNVDTGAGLERLAMTLQGKNNIFDTDLFQPIIKAILKTYGDFSDERAVRIVADHTRTAVFMIADGVFPSNVDRGYILRRLLRRAIFQGYKFAPGFSNLYPLIGTVAQVYRDVYPDLRIKQKEIHKIFEEEEIKFQKTLKQGEKEFEKLSAKNISGKDAFILFSTYGFPLELTDELAREKGIGVDKKEFAEEFARHQALSRAAAAEKFKGGLADHGEMSIKYHTATHLLNRALRAVLGEHISQKGSNITAERLRFDFAHPQKMTDEEKQKVEDLVNRKIREALPVSYEEVGIEEAKAMGATGVFEHKYGEKVKVYKIGDFSLEICGGPHVKNTGELGRFKIQKEEAVAAGVRRVKAVLE